MDVIRRYGILESSKMRTGDAHPLAHRPEWYLGCAFFPLLYIHYGVGEFAHPLYSNEAVRKFPLYVVGGAHLPTVTQSPRD